jgi:hypothetical protein
VALMSIRHAEFELTSMRITLLRAIMRNCRHAMSMGRTISATSERAAELQPRFSKIVGLAPDLALFGLPGSFKTRSANARRL